MGSASPPVRFGSTWLVLAIASLIVAGPRATQAQSPGIPGRLAPSWGVDTWQNLPDGATTLDVADLRGRVVYLYCFQSWCPGCHRRGFPTLQTLIDHYADAPDVVFVAVQTTFEGFDVNTAKAAWETARRYELTIPVGHTAGTHGVRSTLMRGYRTGGTPWTVIIDRAGKVRANGFHFEPREAIGTIDTLLAEAAPADAAPERATPRDAASRVRTLPVERGGQDVVGTRLPALELDAVLTSDGSPTTRTDGKVTLYRWWTDSCPWCEASLPALERLRKKHGPRGLEIVAVYHPKPPRRVKPAEVVAAAHARGYRGTLAIDADWSALEAAYLDRAERRYTSISLLVDQDGVVRFVHPGPVFHPSDDPKKVREDADYRAIDAAVEVLLGAGGDAGAGKDTDTDTDAGTDADAGGGGDMGTGTGVDTGTGTGVDTDFEIGVPGVERSEPPVAIESKERSEDADPPWAWTKR